MATVHDVAAFILLEYGPMTTYKLQKLVYYAQGWSLGLNARPLFNEPIQAWTNGPASPALFGQTARSRQVSVLSRGDAAALAGEADFLRRVLGVHAAKEADELVDDTHAETPWAAAREGLPANARSQKEITHESLKAFFGNPVIQSILRTDGEEQRQVAELVEADRGGA